MVMNESTGRNAGKGRSNRREGKKELKGDKDEFAMVPHKLGKESETERRVESMLRTTI